MGAARLVVLRRRLLAQQRRARKDLRVTGHGERDGAVGVLANGERGADGLHGNSRFVWRVRFASLIDGHFRRAGSNPLGRAAQRCEAGCFPRCRDLRLRSACQGAWKRTLLEPQFAFVARQRSGHNQSRRPNGRVTRDAPRRGHRAALFRAPNARATRRGNCAERRRVRRSRRVGDSESSACGGAAAALGP